MLQSTAAPADSEFFDDDGVFEDLIVNADAESPRMEDSDTETIDIDIDEYMPTESSSETTEIIDEAPLDIDLSFSDEENFEEIKPDFPEESTDGFTADSDEIVLDESDAGIDFDDIEDMGSIDDIVIGGDGENTDDIGSTGDNFPEEQSIEAVDLSSFDDDTGSFTAENNEEALLPETSEETVYNMDVFADDEDETAEQNEEYTPPMQETDAAMLEKIMNELSILREDINRLKNDVDSLKLSQNTDTVCTEDKKSASGFFGDVEDDDTIALSGDELNSILTSADFTAEDLNSEVPPDIFDETGEPFDDGDTGTETTESEESRFDDSNLDIGDEKTGEELPDEIAIPKAEDIVVASSTEDFFAEEDVSEEIDEAALNLLSEEPAAEDKQAEPIDTADEENEAVESEEPAGFENESGSPSADGETADIGEETVGEPEDSTADEIAAESNAEEEEEEDLTQYSPVDQVFNSKQWQPEGESSTETDESISPNMREEIKSVLAYMDQLLENLPEEKIIEFAQSEQFPLYKKLFNELGLS